eukprot:354150-Chlamydomonas_euryale.AAC.6
MPYACAHVDIPRAVSVHAQTSTHHVQRPMHAPMRTSHAACHMHTLMQVSHAAVRARPHGAHCACARAKLRMASHACACTAILCGAHIHIRVALHDALTAIAACQRPVSHALASVPCSACA